MALKTTNMNFLKLLNLFAIVAVLCFSGCKRKTAESKKNNAPEKSIQLSIKSTNNELEQFLKSKNQTDASLEQAESSLKISDDIANDSGQVNQQQLRSYRDEALFGCNEQLIGCKNIEALKLKPNSATILILGLATESNPKVIDQVIRLSLEVRARTTDERFQRLFMLTILKNLKSLLEINPSLYNKIVVTNIESLSLLNEAELLNFFSGFSIFDLKNLEFPKNIKLKFLGFIFTKQTMIDKNSDLIKAGITNTSLFKYISGLEVKIQNF